MLLAPLLALTTLAAPAPPPTAPLDAAPLDATPIDLSALRNHDLFDGAKVPLLKMATWAPWDPPVPLDFDGRAAPDAVLLRSADAPGAPQEVVVPVGRAGRTLYLLTAAQGPLDVRDIVADGTVAYADGRTQGVKWLVGEHAWPAWAGVSGRNADPLLLGTNAGGDAVTASLLTVDLSWPDVPVASVTIRSRPGALSFALLAATISGDPPVTVQAVAAPPLATYPFDVDGFPELGALAPPRTPATVPVVVRDGHLAFADGRRARFWGVNLVQEGAVPDPAVADAYARHLAAAGFDLARPHHVDANQVGLLNPRRGEPGEPLAVPEALDRYDRFLAALKREGIYWFLETWTLRSFRPEEGLPEPAGLSLGHKNAVFWEPAYVEAKKAWFRALYDRVNPHTGLRYAEDPAVAMVEIANEDSLLVSWNGGTLERLPAGHRRRLDELWSAWLRRKYGNDARLAKAWEGRMRGGLQAGETLALDSVAREPSSRQRTELWPATRAADLVTFYSELEAAHYADMARFFREELGFRAPIVCNTSFGVPVADALLAACDVVDLHVYWDPQPEQHVFQDVSMVEKPLHSRILEKLAWCQEGKPCFVSELNHAWPNRFVQEAPLLWAALLARQDVDGVAWFAWSHGAFDPDSAGPAGSLDLEGRLDALAQMPVAAALFRSGAVAPPPRRHVRWWSADGLLRDLAEPPGLWLDPQVSWRAALDDVLRTSFAAAPPAPRAAPAPPPLSEGPVRWWPDDGRFVVDTPTVQAIVGHTARPAFDREGAPTLAAGANPSALRAVLDTFAAVSLASLDGTPLGEGGPALLVAVGRTEREGTLRPTGGPGLLVWGRGAARLERLRGFVDVRFPGRPVVEALDGAGRPAGTVPVTRAGGGWWRVALRGLETPWLRLRPRR